ncbi:NPC intracellular cholesterol transporter 2 homolog a-like isoform X2 [Panulirus ornatus]|uniref:NPC intracellular cholesterol transporter 2 homolog a-like isoform X2 n=1 Tax=Panulirus ornatus TaxID=150431 RepID=UPI003A88C055
MRYLVLLLAISAVVYGGSKVRNCGSSATVNVNGIKITGCDKNPRNCIFKKGQNANMSLPFTSSTQIQAVHAKVSGHLGPLTVPFSLPQPNACINSGLVCPLQADQPNVYVASLPVKRIYPSVRVIVQWELLDEHDNKLVCIKFPVQLQN